MPQEVSASSQTQSVPLKALVIGSTGFWGRNVVKTLVAAGHSVSTASRSGGDQTDSYHVDLLVPATIGKVLKQVRPDVIISCAGVVDTNQPFDNNPIFAKNLLDQIAANELRPRCVVVAGSAGEYGIVRLEDIPVDEDVPLNATGGYGLSKVKETQVALKLGHQYGLRVVVARIFNPIGPGMGPRFLISGVLRQIDEIRAGSRDTIELNRLDSERDCIHVLDAAEAVRAIIEGEPKANVYCIGTGVPTSNGRLVELMLENSGLTPKPPVRETSSEKEPLVATQADISRIQKEFGWKPVRSVEETIGEIMHAKVK
jgi:nucleoside-diphosphate-sugar epimerase